ncbi:hypothetical protein S7711_01757 [Stachybotrys chartarum IBT 7711]|uniref:Uncharacterized protein n=1 Tax=Stachybotrys chartarum (strain CBS 109288 / IBT 7711) TaxID=1280523 RepID=A0A084AVH8_STACB|nr:hypothetical protein S7711_01757 [Stachybotrys chartarum IBT 7711]KFA49221.1 hypothetical protein S40293_09266 [Stachybotrys chartarum IBT 40293]KFA76136.1 hypothetical protein S40288_00316 [Stachybotrys chartarum IBT 40288]
MRFNSIAGAAALSAIVAPVVAKELPVNELIASEFYDSGIIHDGIVNRKLASWNSMNLREAAQYPRLNYTKCVNGIAEAIPGDAASTFKCKDFDLYDFINHEELGSFGYYQGIKSGSSIWGWTDPESGREFAASGVYDGVSFLEILPEGRLVFVGFLPKWAPLASGAYWTEIRPYKHYMVIGSELVGNGIQIFDMSKLVNIDPADYPYQFTNEEDLTSHYNETLPIGRSHNVVVNEELEYGVAVGAQPRTEVCRSGLHFFSLSDPTNPVALGCNGDDGYIHDAQCLVYRGPDERYHGKDICYGYNEDTLTIYDVTDKAASYIISRTTYEGARYTHQGWVNDVNWQEFLFMDDELDEGVAGTPAADGYPVTFIWDIRDLEAPKQTGLYKATNRGIDHNQYVFGDLIYQSNYGSGMRVYDISSVPQDPTGKGVCEIAYFDTHPEDDNLFGGGIVDFIGSWHSYAGFKSGLVLINTIERGVFLVKMTKRDTCKPNPCSADNCLRAMRANSIPGRLEESQEFCGEFTKTFVADVSVVPAYARDTCGDNVISRVSSACDCLPTAA